jgi:hypothetical protein
MSDLRERTRAAAALGRFVGTAAGRSLMLSNGYTPAMETVIALPDDTISDVMDRVTAYKPPVLVAVWRETNDKFTFIHVAPGQELSAGSGDQFSGKATIGMLAELMDKQESGRLRFKLTEWAGYEARGLMPV